MEQLECFAIIAGAVFTGLIADRFVGAAIQLYGARRVHKAMLHTLETSMQNVIDHGQRAKQNTRAN